jgi:prepilin-type N-terminal cleavage/methylation domain-containing protein
MSSLKKVTQKGFTIVELLIVIVVIGILAALVITTYSGIQQNGRNTERQTDIKAVKGQLEAYYTQNGSYPQSGAITETFIAASMKGLDKEALKDPKGTGYTLNNSAATGTQYGYVATPTGCTTAAKDCTAYTLSYQEEGKTGVTNVESLSN